MNIEFVGMDDPTLNYWQSWYPKCRLFFLQWQDGVGELMVPDACFNSIAEMATAKHVLLDITPEDEGVVFTLWFDDGTKTPFYLYIDQDGMGGRFTTECKNMKLHVHSRHGLEQRHDIKAVALRRNYPGAEAC